MIVGSDCQLDSFTWKDSLNEGLSRSGWIVDGLWGTVLVVLTWEAPAWE